jgi:hypothetical protein
MKKHLGFIIFFIAIMLLFLGKVIFMKSAFLDGDYLQQFYPWSMVYSEAIKNFQFPFWCRYFHSGFPLMAEGQIGGFYPLNIIMFFLLPFKVAYNFMTVFHFIIAGVFTYLYTRKLGAGQWGGALAALCFCFGSAYAGCITLRTLAWFPAVLLLFEYLFQKKHISYLIIASVIVGMQFLAGFMQMAAYAFLFYFIYMTAGFFINRIKFKLMLVYCVVFSSIVFIIALPQALLTLQLLHQTARDSATLGFALWGSFTPPMILSAFFPYWLGAFGQQLFIGSIGILFLVYGCMQSKDSHGLRPIIIVGVVSFLMALGRYNPLYVFILRITEFYGMRNPSKFLFFSLFTGSVLAGVGFSSFFNSENKKRTILSAKIFLVTSSLSLLFYALVNILLRIGKKWFLGVVSNYVQRYVIGKAHHRYSASEYLARIPGIYETILKNADLTNIFMAVSVIMLFLGIFLAIYVIIMRQKPRWLKTTVFSIIFLDIFVYSFYGTGFRGNIESYSYLKPTHANILNILKTDKELFRILPFGLKDQGMPFWIRPNANIIVQLDNIAGYTPLAKAGYRQDLKYLEIVDDSLGYLVPENKALVDYYQKLRILNVKYVLSLRDLKYNFLEKITDSEGVFLYRLKGFLPRVFFTVDIKDDIFAQKAKYLTVNEYKDGFLKVEISVSGDGFLVFSENHDPGWKAFVNGGEVDIIKVQSLVQAIKIGKGTHTVIFKYSPNLRAIMKRVSF